MNLEKSLVPKLNVCINFWSRYMDNTITFVKIRSVEYLLSFLKNFHPKIKFTYEMEFESKLAFLDNLLHRDGHDIIKTVYRKVTNNDVYLNWYFFSKGMETRNILIFGSTSLSRLLIIAFTERRIKTFRRCFCDEKMLSYMGC